MSFVSISLRKIYKYMCTYTKHLAFTKHSLRFCFILIFMLIPYTLSAKSSLQAKSIIDATGVYDKGPNTQVNRLIKLRYAMDKVVTVKDKRMILDEIGETGTFVGLMFAGNYLDNVLLQKHAARAVIRIAYSHPEYWGTNVRLLVMRAANIVGGKSHKLALSLLRNMPQDETGYVSLFNGKDLTGWKGLVKDPIKRSKMTSEELAAAQTKADEQMRKDWKVSNGLLTYVGSGYDNICTEDQYGDFEMYVDWMLDPKGKEPDAGIYLRGTPQVQIWDTARVNVGAQVGSGGLYNNLKHKSHPSEIADNMTGVWNSFFIKMIGDKVTVLLNGVKVVDSVVMENYWDRSQPIPAIEQIELQAHGSKVYYRDIYVKRIKN